MRIVIDTNVLIAALTHPSGSGARVVSAWLEGRLEVVSSEATLREAEAAGVRGADLEVLRGLVQPKMPELFDTPGDE